MFSDLKATVLGLSFSMTCLASVAVTLRLYARRLSKAHMGTDDYLALAALFFTICFAVDSLLAVYLGNLGGHIVLNSDGSLKNFDQVVLFQKLELSAQFLSIPAEAFAKLSVLYLYKRIFLGRYFDPIVKVLIGIVIIWMVGFILAMFLYCLPLNSHWNGMSSGCSSTFAMFGAITVTDVLTDVLILSLPIPQIWKLHLPTGRKIQLGLIFLLGSFVVFSGIARCVLPISGLADRADDYSYGLAPLDYWTTVEVCVGVISACLPTLLPVIKHFGNGWNSDGAYTLQRLWRRKHPESSSTDSVLIASRNPSKNAFCSVPGGSPDRQSATSLQLCNSKATTPYQVAQLDTVHEAWT